VTDATRYRWETLWNPHEATTQEEYFDTLVGVRAGLVRSNGGGAWVAMIHDTKLWKWYPVGDGPMEYQQAKQLIEITVRLTN